MGDWTKVTIDFEQSHLLFPKLISAVLALLFLAILIRDRKRILNVGPYWRGISSVMDKRRFFGTLALTLIYFSLMIPVGNIWPNTGLGFLLCSIPYIFLTGLLFMHERHTRPMAVLGIVAVTGPAFVWWLFTYPFFLTLP